jgi:hypothetical protein
MIYEFPWSIVVMNVGGNECSENTSTFIIVTTRFYNEGIILFGGFDISNCMELLYLV